MGTEVTPKLVMTLRERTGIGMAKCKEALVEANGDIELAIQNLRKAGIASAVKKSDRETNEGKVLSAEDNSHIVLVEINAETDFVVKNEKFQAFAEQIAQEALSSGVNSLETLLSHTYSKDPSLTIDQFRAVTVQSLGENLVIRRVAKIAKKGNCSYGLYSHMGGKIVSLVVIEGAADQAALARDIAMHVAATSPEYLNPEAVPEKVKAQEEEIARSQLKGKPVEMLPKILEGKMRAYYEQNCLVNQHFVKDSSVRVAAYVHQKGENLKVVDFKRWAVGSQGE